MRRVLFIIGINLLVLSGAAFAQGCWGIGEFDFPCQDPETGCESQVIRTYCDGAGAEYGCIFDSGSGLCCNQEYTNDLLYQTFECPPPKGPKPPVGLKNQGPPPDVGEILEAEVYVPGCGGRYAVIEVLEVIGKVRHRTPVATVTLPAKPGRGRVGLR